jgi:hypothetical protein
VLVTLGRVLLADAAQATDIVVRVDLNSATVEQVESFYRTHPDILGGGQDGVDVLTTDEALSTFRELGIPFGVRIPDAREYESELRSRDYFDHFHDYQEIVEELQEIELDHSEILTVHDIGDGWEKTVGIADRDIWAVKISDNVDEFEREEAEVLIMCNLHAREIITPEIGMYLINYLTDNYGIDDQVTELVNGRQIWIIPTGNPDGLDYVHTEDIWWRKNRRDNGDGTIGVDLNRNWGYMWGYDDVGSSPYPSEETYRGPAPFSEPETQFLRDFVESHTFIISMSYHSYWNRIFYPWGYVTENTPDHSTFVAIAESCTVYNGYGHGNTASGSVYPTNGDSDDWLYGEQATKYKIFGFTPEVGGSQDGFHPDTTRIEALILENHGANLYVIDAVEEYSPRPVFEHAPVPDSEDLVGPYHVVASITSPVWPLDESTPKIHYRWNVGRFSEAQMIPTGQADEFEGWIPGRGSIGTCTYYLSAADSIPRIGYDPPGTPDSLHSFYTGPDVVAPTVHSVTQLPPALFIPEDAPRPVEALAYDNMGLDLGSGLLHYTAGSANGQIPMDFDEWVDGEALLVGLLGPEGSFGDTIWYSCSVSDDAAIPNSGWSEPRFYVYGLEEFEQGIDLWDPGNGWVALYNPAAHSGEWVASDNASGPYENNEDNPLTLINGLDLTGCTTARLSFWIKHWLQEDHDFLYLEASRDGIAWDQLLAMTGRQQLWTRIETYLDGLTGEGCELIQIRFRLVSDEAEVDLGVIMDDVFVECDPPVGVITPSPLPQNVTLSTRPNPTSSSVSFLVSGVNGCPVLEIYDVAGRLVRTLKHANQSTIEWDCRDHRGTEASSGLYFARLRGSGVQTKVVVIR